METAPEAGPGAARHTNPITTPSTEMCALVLITG